MKLRKYPDPILRQKTKEVKDFSFFTENMINDIEMFNFINNSYAIAANQIGILKRFFVFCPGLNEKHPDKFKINIPRIMINPKIIKSENPIIFKEYCLSFPKIKCHVNRFFNITCLYKDQNEIEHELECNGLLSIIIQHELDHLDGTLFIDKIDNVQKNKIYNKLNKLYNKLNKLKKKEK